jgi:hypothetical protein
MDIFRIACPLRCPLLRSKNTTRQQGEGIEPVGYRQLNETNYQ